MLEKYLIKTLSKILYFIRLKKLATSLQSANKIPSWNMRSFHFYNSVNISWHCVIRDLFNKSPLLSDPCYSSKPENIFNFAEKIISIEENYEFLSAKNISGFIGGRVAPCESAKSIIDIGKKVSKDFEEYNYLKLNKLDQFLFLKDDIESFLDTVEWTSWHRKFSQSGSNGAHRTSSLIYLLNHFDQDLQIKVKVRRLTICLSELVIQQRSYAFYLYNPLSGDYGRTISSDDEELLEELGCKIMGTHSEGSESLCLAVIDRSHSKSWLVKKIFDQACKSGKATTLIEYLAALENTYNE